ncbi:MAG: sensor histidine kinase [Firmicutes bacterium]|nr:sensor histidine kinase [Bacillota bacterium]
MIIKTMLILAICAVIMFTAFAIVSIRWSANALKAETEEKCRYQAEKCANQISMCFENAEGTVDALAADILESFDIKAYKKDNSYMRTFMKELSPVIKTALIDVEDAAGLYMTFNPDLSGYDGVYEIWYSLDEDGRPVYTDARENEIYLEAFSYLDASHMQYYFRSAERPMEGLWTDPGYDPDQDKEVFTYSKSVYVEGVFIGVLGADIFTEHTTDMISNMEVEPGGMVFLLNEKNLPIVKSQNSGKVNAEKLWSSSCKRMSNQHSGLIHTDCEGRHYVVSYGQLNNRWILAVVNEETQLFEQINLIRSLILLLSLILAVLTIAASYFAINRFASPIKKAEELLKLMDLEGKVDRDEQEKLRTDEDIESLVRRQLRKQREKDLLIAHQSRLAQAGEMISGITHQWKQPLNKLSILLGNLRDARQYGELTEEELDRTIRRSEEIIDSMSVTINDFRSYLMPDREPEDFSVAQVLYSVLELLEDRISINGIHTEIDCRAEYTVHGYKNALYHILLNVINNAIDAMEESEAKSRRLCINSTSIGDPRNPKSIIEIAVFNSGSPISEEIQGQVFSPYVTTKDRRGGSGLGLAISKSLVEKSMGGSIELYNEGQGVMCRIRVRRHFREQE